MVSVALATPERSFIRQNEMTPNEAEICATVARQRLAGVGVMQSDIAETGVLTQIIRRVAKADERELIKEPYLR